MNPILAQSTKAAHAYSLVKTLQRQFVDKLEEVSQAGGDHQLFNRVEWLRDEGQHGGGARYEIANSRVFNQASVNVSQVHYDDNPEKNLASATALSSIIHPQNPHAPSVHLHISWTELKAGKGYWRMMADLNSAIENSADTSAFVHCLNQATSDECKQALAQGDHYFYIPALGRHRGVAHFYLEDYHSGDEAADRERAQRLIESVIECYTGLLLKAIQNNPTPSPADYEQQLDYHTLYLFQVLTLDRGTTSGLLIHNQNDIGILGSLPGQVNLFLLASWQDKLQTPQDQLLAAIVKQLSMSKPGQLNDRVRQALANTVREHYQLHPQAISLQAQGHVIPSTVENHRPAS